jgi:hypothetical protein
MLVRIERIETDSPLFRSRLAVQRSGEKMAGTWCRSHRVNNSRRAGLSPPITSASFLVHCSDEGFGPDSPFTRERRSCHGSGTVGAVRRFCA